MRPRRLLLLLLVAVILLATLHLDLIAKLLSEPARPLTWLQHGGAVRGQWCRSATGKSFAAFQDIPYARPPTGDLRFAPPMPAEPWRGELTAVCEGPICPQPSSHHLFVSCPSRLPSPSLLWRWLLHLPRFLSRMVRDSMQQREDCLRLNVYVPEYASPRDDQTTGRAVLVYLHGGGFLIGDGSAEEYGPDLFLERGIIVVTLNYRLGVLGFLYGGPGSGAPGNLGLRDQAMALCWVRDNIEAFDGNRTRVTLWGESAGAVSAHLHTMGTTAAAGGPGLFQRIILSSGVAVLPWSLQDRPLTALRHLAADLGYRRPGRPDHDLDLGDLVRFLRTVRVERLVAASDELKSMANVAGNAMTLLQWLPVVEEQLDPDYPRFLAQDPHTILKEGTFRSVPMMLGVNSREGIIWLAGKCRRGVERLLRHVDANFSVVVADLPFVWRNGHHLPAAKTLQAANLIRGFFFGRQRVGQHTLPAFLDLYSDLIFNIGVREMTSLHLKWASSPLYLYRFAFDGRLGFLKRLIGSQVSGVGHADELGYLFHMKVLPSVSLPPNSPEMVTRERLIHLWTNFIEHGNPTPITNDNLASIVWKQSSIENKEYLDIDVDLNLRADMFAERMKFWSELYRDVLEMPLSW